MQSMINSFRKFFTKLQLQSNDLTKLELTLIHPYDKLQLLRYTPSNLIDPLIPFEILFKHTCCRISDIFAIFEHLFVKKDFGEKIPS